MEVAAGMEEEEEEIIDLPEQEKIADRLYQATIRKEIGGVHYDGIVEDIEMGSVSKERLYRIKYSDGDSEHLTADEVSACLVACTSVGKPDETAEAADMK